MDERKVDNTTKSENLIRDYDPSQVAEIAERLHYRRLALEEKLARIEEASFVSYETMSLMFAPCTQHQVIRDEASHVVDLDNNKHIQ